MTIKQNILFGKEYDEDLYENVIVACKLEVEVLEMEYADKTEINEKNISQTMKAKICLARSLYSLADLYLFDNPFSCFDQKESQELAESVINQFIFTYQQQLTVSHSSYQELAIGTLSCLGHISNGTTVKE